MQTNNFMAETLKQFETADEFLPCRALLQRWSVVPQHVLLDAVEGGLLVPLRHADDVGVPRIERAKLPTMADEDGCSSVDVTLAGEQGIIFSLANILLLEHKFPHVFPGQRRKKRYSEPMDVIMSLLADKELAQMEAMSMRDKYEGMAEKHLNAVHEINMYARCVDRLQTSVQILEKMLSACTKGDVQICDGQAFPQWLCARRRANVPDAETVQFLHEKLKFTQSAATLMVETPGEFKVELERVEKGIPLPHENRRGLYVGIVNGTNKERKKKQSMEKKETEREDEGEDYV